MDANNTEENKQKLHQLSKEKINEFVKKLLVDQNINIKYLPDYVEKQIYKNVLNMLIGLLNNTLATTSIKFLGHELTFAIQPDQTDKPNHEDTKKEIVIDNTNIE